MITAENLTFSYTGSAPFILNGLELKINNGEYVSVVGDNGCGKSTLMKLILRFLKPTHGSIVTDAKKIGYVPQKSDSANYGFPITVYEMLNSYRKLLKIKDRHVVAQSLRQLGLSDFSSSLMGNLSGGQAQKALIARALMGNPDLLLLDEPSAGVDIDSQREIYAFFEEAERRAGHYDSVRRAQSGRGNLELYDDFSPARRTGTFLYTAEIFRRISRKGGAPCLVTASCRTRFSFRFSSRYYVRA